MNKIAGIVLAGGLSSRMGKDKATLKLEANTLLEQAIYMLEACSLDKVFVSGDYEAFNSIPDRQKSLGPIGGLDACVAKLFGEFDALCIIPVDMPFLTANECLILIKKYEQYPIGVYYSQSTFPMILPLNRLLKNYLTEVLTSPHNKDRSLYRLLKTLKLKKIKRLEKNVYRFKNINTQQQWNDCLLTHKQISK
ncbi:MAG: NTP transferase domain-containing protein [Psychromonas sp.]|nr:NTP transferase domain-containing protein [Psychromonas sp.]